MNTEKSTGCCSLLKPLFQDLVDKQTLEFILSLGLEGSKKKQEQEEGEVEMTDFEASQAWAICFSPSRTNKETLLSSSSSSSSHGLSREQIEKFLQVRDMLGEQEGWAGFDHPPVNVAKIFCLKDAPSDEQYKEVDKYGQENLGVSPQLSRIKVSCKSSVRVMLKILARFLYQQDIPGYSPKVFETCFYLCTQVILGLESLEERDDLGAFFFAAFTCGLFAPRDFSMYVNDKWRNVLVEMGNRCVCCEKTAYLMINCLNNMTSEEKDRAQFINNEMVNVWCELAKFIPREAAAIQKIRSGDGVDRTLVFALVGMVDKYLPFDSNYLKKDFCSNRPDLKTACIDWSEPFANDYSVSYWRSKLQKYM